ncbi:MAG: hypothetical protein ACTSYI_08890 [Promethearchaeota archaeon]
MQIIPSGIGLGHSDKVRVLCFDATSKNAFSGGWDHTILKWQMSQALQPPLMRSNPPTLSPTLKFIGHQSSISALVYWTSQGILISGDKQGFIFFWNPKNGDLLAKIPTTHPKITALYLDSAENLLYSGGSDGIIRSWRFIGDNFKFSEGDFPQLKLSREYHGPKSPIHVIRVDPIRKLVICSGDELNIYFWQINAPDGPAFIYALEKTIFSFDIDPIRSQLIGGGQKKKLSIIDYSSHPQEYSLITKAPISHVLYIPTQQSWIAFDFNASLYILQDNAITSRLDDILASNSMIFPAFDSTGEILVLSADTDEKKDENYSIRFYWVKWEK